MKAINADLMLKQENLFNDWISMCDELKGTVGVIQNNFSRLRADGHLSKEQLKQSTDKFYMDFGFKLQVMALKAVEIHTFLLNTQDNFENI